VDDSRQKRVDKYNRFNSYLETIYRDTVLAEGWGGEDNLRTNEDEKFDFGAFSFM